MASLDTTVDGIGHVLLDRLLAIPDYQRVYAWGDDEVNELCLDLEQAIAGGASEYFLGSIVTTRTEGVPRQHVIDGQQRLATISLMYAAIRDIFRKRSDERWRDIERDFLGKQNMITRIREPKLVLNAEDNHVFADLVLREAGRPPVPLMQDSHRRLANAYAMWAKTFEDLIAGLDADNWQEPLLRWYTFVLEKARVIEVSVDDESRAFIIFETLNDRGLNLNTSDLLKNHLFGTAGVRIEEAKLLWTRAMAPFASGGGEVNADAFLRHYWASRRGVARVKALYSQMKPEINTPDTAIELSAELAATGPLWAAMFDRDADLWKTYSTGTLAALDTLRNLNVEQCRPLLLAALRRLATHEVERLFSCVVAWSIRWFVVGGGSAGVVERLYAEAASRVTSGEYTSAAQVIAAFTPAVPNDLRFVDAWKILTVRRGWLARYYLTALERHRTADPEPELVLNEDVDAVNLEHVLPRNAVPGDWPAFNPDELQEMRLMIGNQCLLRKSQNAAIANGRFGAKKDALAASGIQWTKEVGESADWTPASIIDRQERMAKAAAEIWPVGTTQHPDGKAGGAVGAVPALARSHGKGAV